MEIVQLKDQLLELADKAEGVLEERGIAKAEADQLRGEMEEQETKVEIVRVIAYNSILEKLPEKSKDFAAKQAKITYRGETTNYIEQLEILGRMKRDVAKKYAVWQRLNAAYETINTRIGVLRSILGYDREIARATH